MPTSKPRPEPVIPDHEVLRKFGGGAYGEVWLARGVTGALRAVKIVYREDFDDERGFEREFEGILKFEPISRDHPGMVNILHVGRSPDGNSFYYYVMELGDDVVAGRDINPVEYEGRTLRSDAKRAKNRRLDTDFCIDVGLRLAEALRHLHDNGLAHRDVKPSNVIFVNGKAKLADIGLVAARGQRTFVGTEGFVPPEGPGSTQADVYSLGKVLYEIATGKDRLDFPELPDELPSGPERKRWLALNQIICDICEPHLSKRKISTAGELAEALRRLQQGKRRRRRRPVGAVLASLAIGAVLALGTWEAMKESEFIRSFWVEPPEKVLAYVKVVSQPEGADVFDFTGVDGVGSAELLSSTPTDLIETYVGEELHFRLEKPGYQPYSLRYVVEASAAEEPKVLPAELKVFSPPVVNVEWTDHLGQNYRPTGADHESVGWIGEAEWREFAKEKGIPEDAAEFVEIEETGRKRRVVLTSQGYARDFCFWLATKGIEQGYLTADHQAREIMDGGFTHPGMSERAKKELRPFRCRVSEIQYGRLAITTEPAGAEVYVTPEGDDFGYSAGNTSGRLEVQELKPGTIELLLMLEGYKPRREQVQIAPGDNGPLHFKLELNNSVVMDRPWENSLGMRFVPIGKDLMASVWETRVKDFDAYLLAKDKSPPLGPDFLQGPDHPVVNVTRNEAESFCVWLTEIERQQERIARVHEYRLPTDYEWSLMAGLRELRAATPSRRDTLKDQVFLWGKFWPPGADGKKPGNLADLTAANGPGVRASRVIPGYDDGFERTAPVGSFEPNELGIHDLCGNVQEWVSDNYSPSSTYGVLRGGGWNTYQEQNLYAGYRNTVRPDVSDNTYGFRVVLARTSQPAEKAAETKDSDDG